MAPQTYYAAHLDVRGRDCLVVGGGSVALEKAEGLLAAGARVTVVAPSIVDELLDLDVRFVHGAYRSSDLNGRFLVIAATSDNDVNRRVSRDAEERGLLCNVADVPELCNFILPAIHRAGPITIAVSTSGASPALAKRLRDQFAAQVGDGHVELAERLRELRPSVKSTYATYDERKQVFERIV
jgi:precorrin-2 dehydrogenase / sirohydrochlorin ferrochelatase